MANNFEADNEDSNYLKKAPVAIYAFAALVFFCLMGFLGYKIIGYLGDKKSQENLPISYVTKVRTELRAAPDVNSQVKTILKEESLISGVGVGKQAPYIWLEVTTVDGAHGFVEAESVSRAISVTDLNAVVAENQKIVTSTNVYLRALPSLSARLVGVAEGGTRMMADGSIVSEGEEWLRVPLGDVTAFIMARFTTPDDDRQGNSEGFGDTEGNGVDATARTIVNVQSTPFENARVLSALTEGAKLRVLGQTNAGIWWYIVALPDGTQGFAPKEAIAVSQVTNKWVYPDGSEAPGPNIPQSKAKAKSTSGTNSGENAVDAATTDGDVTVVDGTKTDIPAD